MKKLILFSLFLVAVSALPEKAFAQKETFDITSFTPPKGWTKQKTEAAIQFTKEDAPTGAYCLITLYKAVPGAIKAKENFDLAWKSLLMEMVTVSAPAEMQPSASENGWDIESGFAPFESDGSKGVAILVTGTSSGKMVNCIILTNTDTYEKEITAFLESVSIKKMESKTQTVPETNKTGAGITGTWSKSSSTRMSYGDPASQGHDGYRKDEYTFNSNGTYIFLSKTFGMSDAKLILIRENGSYVVSGTKITISPQKSVIQAWSKKDGVDKWGKLLSTQNRPLEKITYTFTRHYFSGIQLWNLVLQASKPTSRDGPFSNNTTFTNAWYYAPISANNTAIELPGGQQQTTNQTTPEPLTKPAIKSKFAFNTTNFDDGWTSTEQADWVQVTKGNIKVLIHYPNKDADEYSPDLLEGLKHAWNVLVAPKYSTASNFEFKPIHGWESIEFAEADAVEKGTGKQVHVVLFKKNFSGGRGKFIEIITSSKNEYEQEFGPYQASSSGWEKLEKMGNYNKFAVAASDLSGKWTTQFTGMVQYVNVNTGLDAGMNTHSSSQNFYFGPGNSYKWDLAVASGMVGNIKFQGVKSNGKFSMAGNWQVNFSDIEGKPRKYDVYFSCIKGFRILWIDNTAYAKVE
jgi:hypothetical protein